ncbi:MAG: hypothetical protein Q9205_004224 [Flavoplaca limonia]
MAEETLERSLGDGETVGAPAEIAKGMEDQQHKADGLGNIAADANDDNVSIASSEISRIEMEMRLGILRDSDNLVPSESVFVRDRKVSDRFAKASGLYARVLESRVRMLESQIRDIQLQTGLRKEKEVEVEPSPTLDGRCDPSRPLEPVEMPTKELRSIAHGDFTEEGAACLVLGFGSGNESLPEVSMRPRDQPVSKRSAGGGPNDQLERDRFKAVDLDRILFMSPWLFILIELLTGQDSLRYSRQFVYPFKHLLTYSEHVKLLLERLTSLDLDSFRVEDMVPTLTQAVAAVANDLGSEYSTVEISNENTTKVLVKLDFTKHFQKAAESASSAPSDPSQGDVPVPPSTQADSLATEAEQTKFKCTCLKDARDHLQALFDVMNVYLSELMAEHSAIAERRQRKIKFYNLWLLFKPGSLITKPQLPYRAYRVLRVHGGRPLLSTAVVDPEYGASGVNTFLDTARKSGISPFVIECMGIDFDGANFGPIHERVEIGEFEGWKTIVELEAHPIDFVNDAQSLKNSLIARGHRFAQLRGFQHKKHSGLSLTDPEEEIDSEVIVDLTMAYRQPDYLGWKPQLGIEEFKRSDYRELYENGCPSKEICTPWHNRICDDTVLDNYLSEVFITSETNGVLGQSSYDSQPLSEDQLILLPYRVHAFSLRSRKWVPLNIENLADVQDDKNPEITASAFNDLVIREDYKTTVKALVMSHTLGRGDRHQVDLVRGKGKGLIILLHGVPGVGKTSTAECVAAYTRSPLFPITCGDIGQTAVDVEANLDKIFLQARKWGCVLLLDEADVFLAKRERDSIERNALVTVFLRALEYYSGILFLTTNRIGAFDEAFISRIHMSLYFPDLDQDNTFKVWAMNLARLQNSGRNIFVDKEPILEFTRNHWKDGHRWNGRQIRNAFQTAIALAEYDFHERCNRCATTREPPPAMPVVEAKHFKAVAETSAQFHDYLTETLGGSTHKLKAKMGEVRSDSWQDRGVDTPSGKKYSMERAVRMKGPQNRASDVSKPIPPQQQAVPVAAEPIKPISTEPPTMTAGGVDEAEEFRQMLEEERKREKMERFARFKQEQAKGL